MLLVRRKQKLGNWSCSVGEVHAFLVSIQPRCMYLQCMLHAHNDNLWTDRWHVCISVSRRSTCFRDGQPCAMKWKGWQSVCSKSSRKWARFQTPQWMWTYGYFSRLHSLLRALSSSSISLLTSHDSGCILVLTWKRKQRHRTEHHSDLSFAILTSWQWDCYCRYSARKGKYTLFINRTF